MGEILIDGPAEAQTMTVAELLGAQRGWGQVRTRRALRSVSLSEAKELRGLTSRQVRLLLTLLRPLE